MLLSIYDLLFQTKRLYDLALQPVCERHGMTRTEVDILLFLANNPSFDTATEMVMRRRLAKSHVSASIKTLTAQGFLEPFFQEGNRKTIHLKLLPAAETVVTEGREMQRRFTERLFQGFTAEELQEMEARIGRVLRNIRTMPGGET